MSAVMGQGAWYADGLRWIGSLFVNAADRLERRAAANAEEPWPEMLPPHERLFELRNRIHNGYY